MVMPILAVSEMRGSFIACVILLITGVVVLRLLRRPSAANGSRAATSGFAAMISFVAGPLIALLWSVAEVFWLQPGFYHSFSEYLETLLRFVVLGITCGAVGAAIILLGDRLKTPADAWLRVIGIRIETKDAGGNQFPNKSR